MPEGHDTTIEVSNIMSFVLYTQILKQSVLKPASPGITLINNMDHMRITGNEPSSVILSQTKWFHTLKMIAQKWNLVYHTMIA